MQAQAKRFVIYFWSLARTFHNCHNAPMEWPVEYTDEFGVWWDGLSVEEQVDLR
jgi:hypothetical protein